MQKYGPLSSRVHCVIAKSTNRNSWITNEIAQITDG